MSSVHKIKPKKYKQSFLQRHKLHAVLAVLFVGVVGVYILQASHALTPTATVEPENGTVVSAAVISDTGASGGKYVKFGTPTVPPSGEAMPVGDVPGWNQVVAQDFNTARPVGSFSNNNDTGVTDGLLPYPNGWKTNDQFSTYHATKTMSTHDGLLDVFIHSEAGIRYGTAFTIVHPTTGWGSQYMRTSMRFRTDSSIPRFGMAALLWPDSNIWGEGEIDYPEGNFDDGIHVYDHCVGANPQNNCVHIDTNASYQQWHTATTEWTPSGVKHYLDGVLLTPVFNVSMPADHHWSVQIGSNGSLPDEATQGHLYIDWMTMYDRTTAP